MRKSLLFVFLLGCGRSECQDYATVFCSRAELCGYEQNGVIIQPSAAACEKDMPRQLEAARVTEEQCKATREKITPMNCAQFRAYLSSVAGR